MNGQKAEKEIFLKKKYQSEPKNSYPHFTKRIHNNKNKKMKTKVNAQPWKERRKHGMSLDENKTHKERQKKKGKKEETKEKRKIRGTEQTLSSSSF